VFVTASQTPRRVVGSPLGAAIAYGPANQINVKQASCTLSSTKGVGGGALCTTPVGDSLPLGLDATLHQVLQARTGGSLLPCFGPTPLGQPSGTGSFVVICLDAGTNNARFVFKSPGGSQRISVSTASTGTLSHGG
jgi:hypothetical protein